MKPLYIFDLDGTLSDASHRTPLIAPPKPDWRAFYAACFADKPIASVINVMNALLYTGNDVWIFSGRSDEVRELTVGWLETYTHLFTYMDDRHLMMRREGDYTADDVLKKSWLDGMLHEDRERLIAAFDDRDRIVKMWRDNGVKCFQVAPGDF